MKLPITEENVRVQLAAGAKVYPDSIMAFYSAIDSAIVRARRESESEPTPFDGSKARFIVDENPNGPSIEEFAQHPTVSALRARRESESEIVETPPLEPSSFDRLCNIADAYPRSRVATELTEAYLVAEDLGLNAPDLRARHAVSYVLKQFKSHAYYHGLNCYLTIGTLPDGWQIGDLICEFDR